MAGDPGELRRLRSPERSPSDEALRTKLELCAGVQSDTLAALNWGSAAAYLRAEMPATPSRESELGHA